MSRSHRPMIYVPYMAPSLIHNDWQCPLWTLIAQVISVTISALAIYSITMTTVCFRACNLEASGIWLANWKLQVWWSKMMETRKKARFHTNSYLQVIISPLLQLQIRQPIAHVSGIQEPKRLCKFQSQRYNYILKEGVVNSRIVENISYSAKSVTAQ